MSLAEHQRVVATVSETLPTNDERVLDLEFHRKLEQMQIPGVSLEEVRRRLSKISGTLTDDFIAERQER